MQRVSTQKDSAATGQSVKEIETDESVRRLLWRHQLLCGRDEPHRGRVQRHGDNEYVSFGVAVPNISASAAGQESTGSAVWISGTSWTVWTELTGFGLGTVQTEFTTAEAGLIDCLEICIDHVMSNRIVERECVELFVTADVYLKLLLFGWQPFWMHIYDLLCL